MENYSIFSSDPEQDKLNDKSVWRITILSVLTMGKINWMTICMENYNIISSDSEQDKLNDDSYGELQHQF